VVEGGPAEDEGRIDLPLGRKDATRGWWMKHDPQGQPAVTTWTVLGRMPSFTTSDELASATARAAGSSPPPCGEGLGVGVAVGGQSSLNNNHPPPHPFASSPDAPPVPHLTWLALEPLTGRTHQLRVHCAAMGWPILGDSVYGSAPRSGGPGLHLHAREIVVPLYKNRAPIEVTAPVPPHMHERLRACGWSGETLKGNE
jgi:tRNA pseudouridine32 synthase/23S rRNA pseudouridine746 synthase